MKPTFTSHNIRLDDGTFTKTGDEPTLEQTPQFLAARRVLEVSFPQNRRSVRVVDLGCLEGGYSVGFARMGFDAIGMEIRRKSFGACMFVKENLDLSNLGFENDNAWNIDQYGIFDATFCSGLLYHMDKPKKFLEAISSVTKKMLIVHTHFAPEELGANIYNLSEWAENEGLKGRWYTEFGSDNAFRDREHAYWASWDNRASFWLCKEHILDVISKCGFGMVFEQYDCLGGEIAHSMTDSEGYYKKHSRCLFVGIRTGT